MDQVSRFYSGPGGLVDAISSALEAAGLDRAALRPADLAPVDEFHIRGRAASLEIAEALGRDPKDMLGEYTLSKFPSPIAFQLFDDPSHGGQTVLVVEPPTKVHDGKATVAVEATKE